MTGLERSTLGAIAVVQAIVILKVGEIDGVFDMICRFVMSLCLWICGLALCFRSDPQ